MRVLIGAQSNDNLSDDDLTNLYAAEASAAKPWMRCNMVSTVDGSATGAAGDSGSINNDADGRVFRVLRGLADVIVVGAGTAKAEAYGPADVPIVLVSRKGSVYMATCSRSDGVDAARELLGEEHVLTLGSHRVDLALLKKELADRGWVHQLCEGGPHLLRDLVFQGCVDELTATTVPQIVGGGYGRITEGAPVETELDLTLLLEDHGTLLGRWRVKN